MVIKNAIICDVNGKRELDIRIVDGVITEIAKGLESNNSIDAKGAYFIPTLVDINITLKDKTLNSKNIKKIAKKALKGGIGHLLLNPTTTPPVDNQVVLEYAQNSLQELEGASIDITLNTLQEDMSLSNIAILLKKGAIAPYMSTIAKNNLAIKIAEYAKMYDVTLFCKAEDNSLINNGVMLEGDVSSELGLAGIPDLSEVLHVSRMIEIARHFKIRVLFKSIASPRSIYLIDKAKQEGVEVSCEVSIHHLVKSDMACENFNTTAKLNPPLASTADMILLQKALKDSKIDMLTTLHQPSSLVNKEVAFYDAAYGCEGVENALSIYYTKLVKSGLISMQELIKLTVQNPAKAIKKSAGEIKEGTKVSAVLFDPNQKIDIDNPNSLYSNEEIDGKIIMSFKNREILSY